MTRRSRGGDPGSDKSPGGGRLTQKRSSRYVPNSEPSDPDEGWWAQVLEEADAYLGVKR